MLIHINTTETPSMKHSKSSKKNLNVNQNSGSNIVQNTSAHLKSSPFNKPSTRITSFNTKLGSYIDVIERGIKDLNIDNSSAAVSKLTKVVTLDNTLNDNKYMTLSKNNSKKSNTSNLLVNSVLNNTAKGHLDKSKSENSNVNDLYKFFNENELNFNFFCEFFKKKEADSHLTALNHEANSNQFLFVLVSSNKTTQICRDPISNYETIIKQSQNFFVIEDRHKLIQELLEDSRLINDGLKTTIDDEFIAQIINRKLKRKMETIEFKERNERERYDSFHNKTFSLINNTSLITNVNNFLSNRSIENLNHINSKDQTNFKEQTNSCEYTKWSQYTIKMKASRILPEGVQSGVFLINLNGDLKFKPLINNYKDRSFKSQLSKIQGVVNYRYIYKLKSLNFFFYNSSRSKIFDFESEADCAEVLKYVTLFAPNLDKKFTDLEYHSSLWAQGCISNFDYLIFLNNLASRSFSDLSQYPIFPWVLKNYEDDEELDINDARNYRDLSKPIGAQNDSKLDRFKDKYKEMLQVSNDIPYLYGTFYSTPASTVQFLIRNRPLFFLRMNNGSFEPADALFKSIRNQWYSAYSIGRDVKELIPEFYSSNGDFLINSMGIDLGKTQNDESVNNVILPKWAKSSTDFIMKMRNVLESEYVSERLNDWIDLIFGYKSRKEEALFSDNLFYPNTYDYNVNIDSLNFYERQGILTQLLEYGQVPIQLFSQPHRKRINSLRLLKQPQSVSNSLPQNNNITLEATNKQLTEENSRLRKELEFIKVSFNREKEKILKDLEEIKKKTREDRLNREKKLQREREVLPENRVKSEIAQSQDLRITSRDGSKINVSPISHNQLVKHISSIESSLKLTKRDSEASTKSTNQLQDKFVKSKGSKLFQSMSLKQHK